jgi:hypothetical protein
MSCYLTISPDGTITRNFVGDATIQLQSANNPGVYQAPDCTGTPPTTDQLPAYTIHTSVSGSPVAAPEFDWAGAPAMLAVAVMVLVMLKARRIKPSGG